jgi:hypothetical protein
VPTTSCGTGMISLVQRYSLTELYAAKLLQSSSQGYSTATALQHSLQHLHCATPSSRWEITASHIRRSIDATRHEHRRSSAISPPYQCLYSTPRLLSVLRAVVIGSSLVCSAVCSGSCSGLPTGLPFAPVFSISHEVASQVAIQATGAATSVFNTTASKVVIDYSRSCSTSTCRGRPESADAHVSRERSLHQGSGLNPSISSSAKLDKD